MIIEGIRPQNCLLGAVDGLKSLTQNTPCPTLLYTVFEKIYYMVFTELQTHWCGYMHYYTGHRNSIWEMETQSGLAWKLLA